MFLLYSTYYRNDVSAEIVFSGAPTYLAHAMHGAIKLALGAGRLFVFHGTTRGTAVVVPRGFWQHRFRWLADHDGHIIYL